MSSLIVTLKTHKLKHNYVGFTKQNLVIQQVRYGSTLKSVIDNLNQYRGPDSQINNLYNQFGQLIPKEVWSMKLKEPMSFYVDTIQ